MQSIQQNKWESITLALAGVFQAAALVEQLAKTGYTPAEPFRACVESLFQIQPESAEQVFSGRRHLELGLKVLSDLLRHHHNKDYTDTLRYVLGVLHLQKKLNRRQDMLQVIRSRIQHASQQAEHFSTTHENVIANLAGIYSDTLSTFKFRIQVTGDYNYLQQPRIANQVRTLLFAGVRAAILWRQVGGKRWQMIVQRNKLSVCADNLLRSIHHSG